MFSADGIDNNRKGYFFLNEAMRNLSKIYKSKITLCVVGTYNERIDDINIISLGKVKEPEAMAIAYCASDVFILPSLEDNLPNTIIESLMCGTPVIAFNNGGISELVENDKNGFISELISVKSLQKNIIKFIDDETSFDKNLIATNAKEKYDENIQAINYKKLFENILKKNF
jgi:glycosyltransferase involved in cell wall biosynthesis